MLLFLLRHADPIYNPNQLTPLGQRQAESLGRRLAMHGMVKIFASSSQRAKETAQPLCEILKKDMTILDWANEDVAWKYLAPVMDNGRKWWAFSNPKFVPVFNSKEVRDLGMEWYDHPAFADYPSFAEGIRYIGSEADKFLEELGYKHDRENFCYEAVSRNHDRVALFAHQGFGLVFLSQVLDIPYPQFATHFDIGHSGMTVIEFPDTPGTVYPQVIQFSSDGHLYKDGMPTNYQNRIFI